MSTEKRINVSAALKGDLEKSRPQDKRDKSAILLAFDLSKELVETRGPDCRTSPVTLCRALLQFCMAGDELLPSFQFEGKYDNFKTLRGENAEGALLSAWEGACAKLQEVTDEEIEALHTELFDKSQFTVAVLKMADRNHVKDWAQFEAKEAEFNAFSEHFILSAETGDQQRLREQIHSVKKILKRMKAPLAPAAP